MKRSVVTKLALIIILAVGLSLTDRSQAVVSETPRSQSAGNLLANGDMDGGGFYWRPTNHYVAWMWFEWQWNEAVPEFIDGGIPNHNVCYPPPVGLCQDNHSQGYIRWGAPYAAGIYQPVSVIPCTYYRFEAYNRNDGWHYHPKVGIDPTGWQLPIPPWDNPPYNCPPTGYSKCPNPGLTNKTDFPSTMIWSPEFDHAPYTWAAQSVTAEALSTTITVWTYAAPEVIDGPAYSTYWDAASLVQALPPYGVLLTGTLPPADGFIFNVVSSTTALRANLSWQTSQPAVGQVLYHYVSSPTLPVASSAADFELIGTIDSSSSTLHSSNTRNLRPASLYDYAILSRRLVGGACQTSVLTGRLSTSDMLLLPGPLPAPSSNIVGPYILPAPNSNYYVIWQSAKPSYAQVLYHYLAPPTIYPTMTNQVYLPLIASAGGGSGSTSDYEFRTPPDLSLSTLHVVTLTNLLTDSQYSVVAVSAWTEGDVDKVAASAPVTFRTASTALMAAQVRPARSIEQVQACVAEIKRLDICIGDLR